MSQQRLWIERARLREEGCSPFKPKRKECGVAWREKSKPACWVCVCVYRVLFIFKGKYRVLSTNKKKKKKKKEEEDNRVFGTCTKKLKIVVWKHVWKYVWVKKCVKIRVMLFKNWKLLFENMYQTLPKYWVLKIVFLILFLIF